jgi:hypothetical protein
MTGIAKNPLATALGTYYPTHYLVAAFDDPSRAVQALAALRQAGFADAEAEICPGPEFLKNYRDFADHRTIFQRAGGLFPAEEHTAVEEYLAEAGRGASFVTVHVPERVDRARAQVILQGHQGHAMRYYGDHTITDLR